MTAPPVQAKKITIAEYLLQEKIISQKGFEQIATQAHQKNIPIEQAFLESGIVAEQDLLKAKQAVYQLEAIDLERVKIPEEVMSLLPKELAENYKMVPFQRALDIVSIALIDPTDLKAREAAEFVARNKGFRVRYFLTTPASLRFGLKQYGDLSAEVEGAVTAAEKRIEERKEDTLEKSGDGEAVIRSAPVSKIVSVIMKHAVEGEASDIHIEPFGNNTRVRYRIDGELFTTLSLPLYIHDSIVSRVKVLASLKIDETRKPQDGRIHIATTDKDMDFRVSILPLVGHEKIVMRLLDTSGSAPTLESLGFQGRNLQIIQDTILKPNGMFLISGPTGSGKSTTLFSVLSKLNREGVNISTLEDPIEYRVKGVNQSQVRPDVGFSFATGLRSMLRQDPDVILVGEIRDNETAQLAVNAALTGHLVLSTLHTNDAFGAIPRLMDMDVEPFLISNTLNAIGAQRLVRRICDDCKKEYPLPQYLKQEVLDELKAIPQKAFYQGLNPQQPMFYKGEGCARCGNSGYKGRVSIAETIEITPEMRSIIAEGVRGDEIKKLISQQNFITMRQEGILKAMQGVTSIEEVWTSTRAD